MIPGEFEITVNGEKRRMSSAATVADLLRALGLENRRVAVERNFTVVRRAEYEVTPLAADDQLEIVTFVGGG